jgi:opacity protein-like surface antigen
MHFRIRSRWASLSLLAAFLLSLHGVARAQEDAEADAADDDVLEESENPLVGKGSLGFTLGAMKFTGGEDLSTDAGIRPMFRGTFRYVWSDRISMPVEGGFGWNAYGEGGGFNGPDSVGTLATVVPFTVGLDYRFGTGSPSVSPRVGAGLGLYILGIRSGRDVTSRDPITDKERNAVGPGVYVKGGCEFTLKENFTLGTDLAYHQVFSGNDEDFPRGWLDENASFLDIRAGLNYYFTIRGGGASPRGGSEDEDEE